MPPDNGLATKEDLRVAVEGIEKLIRNELGHQAEDIRDLQDWRKEFFFADDGPWRKRGRRLEKIERLAWLGGLLAFVFSPVVAWATIEVVKTIAASLRAGP